MHRILEADKIMSSYVSAGPKVQRVFPDRGKRLQESINMLRPQVSCTDIRGLQAVKLI